MKGQLEIHSQNILPIIKKWLYSDKDIFVRELVSNATDAMQKVKILQDNKELPEDSLELKVEIKIDKNLKTLKFIDTGIGMDAEEIKKYIAQIAFSGAEEFVAKYQSSQEKDPFIGHFGLGFYSAYMVADKVEIQTLSYKPGAEPVMWSCDGSSDYEIDKGTREIRGTEITLYVNKDSEEYLEESRLKTCLKHYCSFLPFPVYLESTLINAEEPLWMKNPSECKEEDYRKFYRYLSPMGEDPLFWIHLNVDYPFHLKGILYFPPVRKDFDLNKSSVQLYCNRVFVTDNCKDLIPEYLMALTGVIDSPDIPLNVSRSYLQMDKTVRQLAGHISKKVSDSLTQLFRSDRDRYLSVWEDIQMFVKLGAIQDEKFYERVQDILVFKTLGGEWLTLSEYLSRHPDKIYYTPHEQHNSDLNQIFLEKKIDVLILNKSIDSYLIHTIEKHKSPVTFQRVDAAVEEHLLDKEREKIVLDETGKTEASQIADFIRHELEDDSVEVEAKSLVQDTLPAFMVMDEKERRWRDYLTQMEGKDTSALLKGMKKKMVVNTNSPLIQSIQNLKQAHPELAKELVHEVYGLALIGTREMDEQAFQGFLSRTRKVLEDLAKLASQK